MAENGAVGAEPKGLNKSLDQIIREKKGGGRGDQQRQNGRSHDPQRSQNDFGHQRGRGRGRGFGRGGGRGRPNDLSQGHFQVGERSSERLACRIAYQPQ